MVLSGARGSGKSTLAAALVAAGAALVTDDYAPLEQGSWHVWPVPYAPGIKRGSWRLLRRYYPDLQKLQVHRLAGLQIRYLELDAARMAPLNRGLPVAALVFPRYQTGAGLRAGPDHDGRGLCGPVPRQVDARSASRGACGDLAVDRTVPAYRLTYGDLDRAADWAVSLLGSQ